MPSRFSGAVLHVRHIPGDNVEVGGAVAVDGEVVADASVARRLQLRLAGGEP